MKVWARYAVPVMVLVDEHKDTIEQWAAVNSVIVAVVDSSSWSRRKPRCRSDRRAARGLGVRPVRGTRCLRRPHAGEDRRDARRALPALTRLFDRARGALRCQRRQRPRPAAARRPPRRSASRAPSRCSGRHGSVAESPWRKRCSTGVAPQTPTIRLSVASWRRAWRGSQSAARARAGRLGRSSVHSRLRRARPATGTDARRGAELRCRLRGRSRQGLHQRGRARTAGRADLLDRLHGPLRALRPLYRPRTPRARDGQAAASAGGQRAGFPRGTRRRAA